MFTNSPEKSVTKAFIYSRVSSARQVHDGDGLASQETRCREFTTRRNYEVLEVFQDVVSGSKSDRPGMNALLKALKKLKGETIAIVVDDISRFARDMEAHHLLRAQLLLAGGRLESPTMKFGEDSDSRLVENLLASVSEHQRRKNAEQSHSRTRARLQNGYWVFSAPIGYRYEKQRSGGRVLVRNEPLATIVQEALNGYASGRFQSQAEVKRFLESKPEYPKDLRGVEVRLQRVTDMLNRLIYSGYLSHKNWEVPLTRANHEPLISYATHLKIIERLKGAAYAPARKDISNDFPLRGFVLCDTCGVSLTACWSKSKTGAKHPYYLCRKKGCPSYGKSIRRDALESAFEDLLETMQPSTETFELARRMFGDAWERRSAEAGATSKRLKNRARQIEKEITSLLDRIVAAKNDAVVNSYEKRISDLESEKVLLEENAVKCSVPESSFEEVFELAISFLSNPWEIWKKRDITLQKVVLRLVFAHPLVFCRNSGLRTPETTFPFKVLSFLTTSNCKMVRVKGLEPPRHRRQNLNLVRLPIPPHPHPWFESVDLNLRRFLTKAAMGCERKMQQMCRLLNCCAI